MTSHPFDSSELGRVEPDLDPVGQLLERYAADVGAEPPMDLAARIRIAVEDQPLGHGPIASLFAAWAGPAQAMAAGALLGLIVVGAVALGQLVDRASEQVGATPSPSVLSTPSPTESSSASPTPSPTPTPTQRPTPTPAPSAVAPPSASDEIELETPEPSESDNSGSGSGNSGPGGGGGGGGSGSGNSGPGGGGDEP